MQKDTSNTSSDGSAAERPKVAGSVLIATDFSENSQEAALHAFQTASLWGSVPHVLHVCDRSGELLLIEREGERLSLTPEKARALVAEHVDRLLALYRSRYGAPAFDIAMSHVLTGNPAEAIVNLARDLRVSLIVVGTSRKKGVERMLLGSTAERVVRHAQCPVMVSRPRVIQPEETIEPPCPACAEVRQRTEGAQIWCDDHMDQQERRHTYHYRDKNSRVRENFPLLFPLN